MTIEVALVKEQGVTFAVVPVKPHILASASVRNSTIAGLQPHWPGAHIILMAQDARGTPKYFGKPDIVNFLVNTPVEALPWGRWAI
jgi:hypothetical protein